MPHPVSTQHSCHTSISAQPPRIISRPVSLSIIPNRHIPRHVFQITTARHPVHVRHQSELAATMVVQSRARLCSVALTAALVARSICVRFQCTTAGSTRFRRRVRGCDEIVGASEAQDRWCCGDYGRKRWNMRGCGACDLFVGQGVGREVELGHGLGPVHLHHLPVERQGLSLTGFKEALGDFVVHSS